MYTHVSEFIGDPVLDPGCLGLHLFGLVQPQHALLLHLGPGEAVSQRGYKNDDLRTGRGSRLSRLEDLSGGWNGTGLIRASREQYM